MGGFMSEPATLCDLGHVIHRLYAAADSNKISKLRCQEPFSMTEKIQVLLHVRDSFIFSCIFCVDCLFPRPLDFRCLGKGCLGKARALGRSAIGSWGLRFGALALRKREGLFASPRSQGLSLDEWIIWRGCRNAEVLSFVCMSSVINSQ